MQDDRGGAVTVLIALVVHKWVESLALSARCLKIGANWWCALRTPCDCLLVFKMSRQHALYLDPQVMMLDCRHKKCAVCRELF